MPQPAVRRAIHRDKIVPVRQAETSWEKAVTAFLAECRRKNLSPATLENYEWYLRGTRMTAFIADHAITAPAQMDSGMLRRFEEELFAAKGGLSAGTVHTFHRILKNFLAFCFREGLAGRDETPEQAFARGEAIKAVEAPKLEEHEPETFTDKEIAVLRERLKDRPRDLMLVNLMLGTGLRLAEVCNLTLDDIIDGPKGPLVRVRQGKGRKDRYVPLDSPGNKLSVQLRRYTNVVRPKGAASDALFLTYRKDGADFVALSPNAIQTLCKRLDAETGIHVNPHKFRHTFATKALSAGLDVMMLQKALGHTSLAMVSRYVTYQTDDMIAAWNQRRD